MGLADQVKSAVKAAFQAAGTLKTTVTLRSASSSYDPVTGIKTQAWSEESGQGLLTQWSQWEINNTGILADDKRLVLKQSEFPSLSPDVSNDARIKIDGVLYEIISPITAGLANAAWDLQLRKV